MTPHRIEVEFGIEARGEARTRVVLDGIELSGVKLVAIESDASGLTEVTLTLAATVAARMRLGELPNGT